MTKALDDSARCVASVFSFSTVALSARVQIYIGVELKCDVDLETIRLFLLSLSLRAAIFMYFCCQGGVHTFDARKYCYMLPPERLIETS